MPTASSAPDAARPLHARSYDLAAAAPLILLCLFGSFGLGLLIARQWPHASGAGPWANIASEALVILFLGLQAVLLAVRRLPVAKSPGWLPRATAVLAANANLALLLLPHETLGTVGAVSSALLTLIGTAAAMVALWYLGRSFSILPEARAPVAGGPYRLIRHPLYLAEMISTLGVMLQFRQPWAFMIALCAIALQLARMRFEEAVLTAAYPQYRAYAQSTARLIPGVY